MNTKKLIVKIQSSDSTFPKIAWLSSWPYFAISIQIARKALCQQPINTNEHCNLKQMIIRFNKNKTLKKRMIIGFPQPLIYCLNEQIPEFGSNTIFVLGTILDSFSDKFQSLSYSYFISNIFPPRRNQPQSQDHLHLNHLPHLHLLVEEQRRRRWTRWRLTSWRLTR